MATIDSSNTFNGVHVPIGTRTSFPNASYSDNDIDAARVIAGSRARSSSAPTINPRRVSVGTRFVPEGTRVDTAPTYNFAADLPPPPFIPVFIPDQTDNDIQEPTFQQNAAPETFSENDSVQDVKQNADFSELLDPIAKVQKKMKLSSIALVASAVGLGILGLALLFSGTATGILPIFIALPLLYVGYNGYQVSKNVDQIIKNPGQIISDIQMDSQKIKECLKEKTFYFDWAINRGTDFLLKSQAPAI